MRRITANWVIAVNVLTRESSSVLSRRHVRNQAYLCSTIQRCGNRMN